MLRRVASRPHGPHPTLASLLYGLARRVAEAGGVEGCSSARAIELAQTAERDLALRFETVIPPNVPHGSVEKEPSERNQARRIGLIGWNTPSGLGHLNRDLARHLPIDRWLIPVHPVLRELPEIPACPTWRENGSDDHVAFLDGLDVLLLCEHPYRSSIIPLARRMGVRIACIPMWEYLDEMSPWIRFVDRMICPTRICFRHVRRLRERLGLSWEVDYSPWPIDIERFPFRARTTCQRFLFVNGSGGARELDGGRAGWDGRKGVGLIAAAARLAPDVAVLVRSQTDHLPEFPANVEVRIGDVDDPADLYRDGDVCVQPSRWEGLGLPMLECQASGLPLITTDAPPMNEHRPFRSLAAKKSDVRLCGPRPIPSHEVDPTDLARTMVAIQGSDITEASLSARRFVESTHSWGAAAIEILRILRREAKRSNHGSG